MWLLLKHVVSIFSKINFVRVASILSEIISARSAVQDVIRHVDFLYGCAMPRFFLAFSPWGFDCLRRSLFVLFRIVHSLWERDVLTFSRTLLIRFIISCTL